MSQRSSRGSRWWIRAALLVACAIGAPRGFAAGTDETAAARAEVERLQADMESAYLDVAKDHERVRAADWASHVFADEFATALAEFVKAARAAAAPRSAREDADAASAVAKSLTVDPPLTRTTLPVVLAETSRAACADRAASPRVLFVASARKVFAQPRPEDAWEAQFLDLPVVQAFRAAKAKLAAALESAQAPPPASTPAAGPSPAPPAPPAEKPAKPIDEAVFLDKGRVWVGPWTGWTTDIPEKQNKRQQRILKAVWMDRYETTCGQYRAFLEGLPAASRRAMLPLGWTIDEKDVVQSPAGKDRHPVAGVTWRQAQSYAESLGKRLPTVDEWDRAAAGAEKEPRLYAWGGSDDGKTWARLGVGPKETADVDAFPDDATPEGIVGMAGDVAELVATCSDRTEIGKSGPEKDKQILVCGGSYASRPNECTASWRWVLDADAAAPTVGFRCVMDDAEYKKRHR